MGTAGEGFGPETRVSSGSVIAGLTMLALALQPFAEHLLDPPLRLQARGYTLLLSGLLVIAWALDRWRPQAGRWFLVFLQTAVVVQVFRWRGVPASLALLAIPTGQAAALIGLPAATVTALGETGLVFALPRTVATDVDGATMAVALAAIWGILATTYALCWPVRQVSQWSWVHYRDAQRLLQEARERTAGLKQALDDLAHANRQLTLINERIAALRLIAEEAQRTKAAFVARVSHEFRTPLNMIIGLVDLMVSNPEVYGQELPPAVAEDLQIVRRNCDHLAGMVNDVLALSQAEEGRLTIRREQVALAEIVDSALAVVRPLLQKKGLSLQVTVPPGLPRICCDPIRIRQVILNLASNAARFTEAGGIAIQVRQEEERVVVSVSDTGPGIPPGDLERIFEPFSQGTGGLRDRNGSGLGLTISKQFVELHGGRIWVESRVGLGATFHFTLPVSPPIEHLAGPARWISEQWRWVERRSRPVAPADPFRPRVILCDDNGGLFPALRHCSDEVELVAVHNLAEASQEAERCPAHAVVFNAGAPSGLWPLVEQARQEIRDTPVIGWAVPPFERAQRAGAKAYLTKPVTRAALEGAMAAVGRQAKRVLVVDDDADALRLWRRMLTASDSGLEIATATSGEEALARLRGEPVDLALLDIVMPGLDGWQVLALKAQEAAIRDIPVILVSAQDPQEQALASPALLVSVSGGLALGKLLHCSLEVAALLLK